MAAPPSELVLLAGDSLAPYAIAAEDRGLELDLIRAAFATQGLKVRFKFVPLRRVSTDVEALGADGATRRVGVALAGGQMSQPYVAYQTCALVADAETAPRSLAGLQRLRVLAFQGATLELGPEFTTMAQRNPRYSEINNQRNQMKLLQLGRTDVVVADRLIAQWQWRQLGGNSPLHCSLPLASAPYAAYFRQAAHAQAFNAGLQRIKAEGEYARILARYGATAP
jgi:polar amino acid transport system substrate-binding protein